MVVLSYHTQMEYYMTIYERYQNLKKQYPDHILLFRIGDFYEAFDEDAQTIADELDLILCACKIGLYETCPMACFPYRTAYNYFEKLITNGHKLALS